MRFYGLQCIVKDYRCDTVDLVWITWTVLGMMDTLLWILGVLLKDYMTLGRDCRARFMDHSGRLRFCVLYVHCMHSGEPIFGYL